MKYTHTYTTRWHDTDANRILRASRLLVYFQETGNIQCKKFGLPLDTMRDERGVGFILSQLSFKVYRPIRAFESIDVSTWCREAKGYSFYRYFDVRVGDELCAQATSVWALVDINSKTLVRADGNMAQNFPYDEPIPADQLPPRARIGKDEMLLPVGQRKICYSDIDYNMHMNNTNYPDMLCDFVPDMQGKFVSEMSLSYLKEARFGDEITLLCTQRDDESFAFRTQNSQGETCLEATLKIEKI